MNNPVAWQMWNAESLGLAKEYNRLLFVSIGYAACHCTSGFFKILDSPTKPTVVLKL